MPTRKYRIVATAPFRTGLRSTVPISTARYMVLSFAVLLRYTSATASLGSAGTAGGAYGTAGRGSGGEPGAQEDERSVAVSGAQGLDADAARVIAVGADDHDVVAVAQVLAVAVVGTRLGCLIVGEGVGNLLGRSGALVARSVGIPGVLVIVARDVGRNVLVEQHDSENQRHGGRNG